jgi:hypothetical protein
MLSLLREAEPCNMHQVGGVFYLRKIMILYKVTVTTCLIIPDSIQVDNPYLESRYCWQNFPNHPLLSKSHGTSFSRHQRHLNQVEFSKANLQLAFRLNFRISQHPIFFPQQVLDFQAVNHQLRRVSLPDPV